MGPRRSACRRQLPPRVLLSYPTDPNDLLLSGELVGGESLAGRPVLVDSPLGKGHVVLFACRPFWRFETQGNFFLAFNAMLNWNDLGAGGNETRATTKLTKDTKKAYRSTFEKL